MPKFEDNSDYAAVTTPCSSAAAHTVRDAIETRRTVRHFSNQVQNVLTLELSSAQVVSREVITDILQLAARAPSGKLAVAR